jgi:N-acetylglucosaminyldiphosphoundecaprenol N-acetyl-beta-D-mannosaminyltransferase
MKPPPRANVLGVGVHALDLDTACALVVERARGGPAGCVCCCDVNSVSCAHRDPRHRAILNRAFLATPDGMPVVWLARLDDHAGIDRVYGPDLLLAVCAATAGTGLGHFFYGGTPGTADRLAAALQKRFPGLRVAGTRTPPYGPPSEEELARVAQDLRTGDAAFCWVGLSTPKQEALMAALQPRLERGVLLGVGAAFDLHSGRIRQAPRWLQRSGLEWLWRLALEPRRLGPRYLRNNPLFLLRALAQATGLRRYPLDTE